MGAKKITTTNFRKTCISHLGPKPIRNTEEQQETITQKTTAVIKTEINYITANAANCSEKLLNITGSLARLKTSFNSSSFVNSKSGRYV